MFVFVIFWLIKVHFRLLPSGQHKLAFNLYPLFPGHMPLPRLHVNLPHFDVNWDEHAQKMIPTHMFIMVSKIPQLYRIYT